MGRRVLNLSLADRWPNTRIRALTGLVDWSEEAERRKFAWARKLYTMSPIAGPTFLPSEYPTTTLQQDPLDAHTTDGETRLLALLALVCIDCFYVLCSVQGIPVKY